MDARMVHLLSEAVLQSLTNMGLKMLSLTWDALII